MNIPTLLRILLMTTLQSSLDAQPLSDVARELFKSYPQFQHTEIRSRRFNQSDLFRWLEPFRERGIFEISPVGQSGEGRMISLLTVGRGPTKVLLWSQMHGDEPTATMALLDIFNFFAQAPDNAVAKKIRENLTLLVIPMLNPDGAERFQRRTAQLIDMNRDARVLGTHEAIALKTVRDTHQPQFGFNLHDQDPRYTVGNSKKVSAVALLAPAFDESRSDNVVRLRAKEVAATLARTLNQFVEGHVSKYDDTFEPRAFGDNVQKWGTSTVLIESGGWPGDRDKMFIRKLNYVGLLTALYAVAGGEYQSSDIKAYDDLPLNTKNLYDLIIRKAQLKWSDTAPAISVDVGVNFDEQRDPVSGNIILSAKVVDVGDLSVFGAFEEIDLNNAPLDAKLIGIEKAIPMEYIQSLKKMK